MRASGPRRSAKGRGAAAAAPAAGERILGIGVDLVEIPRMAETIGRWDARFLSRVFRTSERAYCDGQAAPWRHYAGRFAVKEAVGKAFGTGIGEPIGWTDIEVLRDPETGAPAVRLHGSGRRLAAQRGVRRVLVSLAHSRDHAVAQAVLVG